jgi:uncharacterized coiled-coil protein SlyX
MVKLPNFDDLKKMGSDLIDSAKSVKLNEMVDKFKSSIESVGGKKSGVESAPQDEALEPIFVAIYASLKELADAQAAQDNAVKKMQAQLSTLVKTLEKYQKIAEVTVAETPASAASTSEAPASETPVSPPVDNDTKQ